jgi:membrane-associated HD superfamily phosphohydrolase
MVRATIERNQAEQQFDECPLTLQDLAVIGDTLTQVLASVHHRRIKYPAVATTA